MEGEVYRDLIVHMECADALTWRAVVNLPAAAGDRPLLERFYHIHVVQWAYLQLWRSEPVNVPDAGRFTELVQVGEWARPYYAQACAFIGDSTDHAMARRLAFPPAWTEEIVKRYGSAPATTVGETCMQVVMHSSYHRGQIATRIRELGGEPPLTDYIAWIWQNRPAAVWP